MFCFDLISDLHVETWDQAFDWGGRATSPYCVVAGDVCRDRKRLVSTLRHLGKNYQAVFYIDGNDEHVDSWQDLDASYHDLMNKIKRIPNVVYLQDNMIIINNVAILGTNGWWGFDLDPEIDSTQSARWYQEKWCGEITSQTIHRLSAQSINDANYMIQSMKRLQRHSDVQHVVLVTHTVPHGVLIKHDLELDGNYRFNCMGNSQMINCLEADILKKTHTWCFGHYHMPVDRVIDGVRFVNNCRGRGDSAWRNWAYQPLRIEIPC